MEKGITYNENELKESFERLNYFLERVGNFYGIVHEQIEGKRSNLDKSWIEGQYQELEKIAETLNKFNVSKINMKSLDSVLKELEECRNEPLD